MILHDSTVVYLWLFGWLPSPSFILHPQLAAVTPSLSPSPSPSPSSSSSSASHETCCFAACEHKQPAARFRNSLMIHKVKHGCSFDTPAIPGRTLSTFLDPRITHKTAPAIDRNIGRIHDEIPGGQCPSLLVAMAAHLFSMMSALTSRLTRHVGIAHCYSSIAIAPHIMASPLYLLAQDKTAVSWPEWVPASCAAYTTRPPPSCTLQDQCGRSADCSLGISDRVMMTIAMEPRKAIMFVELQTAGNGR